MTSLIPTQKTAILNSSYSAVVTAIGTIRNNLLGQNWLSNSNQLISNCLDVIKNNLFQNQDMSEYISISSLLHCIDGWGFLGRAIDSHTRGDGDIARHLAYYAELRAAMSILASQGIGIFNNKHYYIDQTGTCHQIPGNLKTHAITWLALEEWATNSSNASLLFTSIIRPNNYSLEEWLSYYPNYGGSIKPISAMWLKTWGLDLSQLPQDRDARNEASYRPTKLHNLSVDSLTSIQFLFDFWELLQPTTSSRFYFLDRHLLRKSLIGLYESVNGSGVISTDTNGLINDVGFVQTIDKFLQDVSASTMISAAEVPQWRRFLLTKKDPQIFDNAFGHLGVYDSKHHFQVISRAMLLLRIASGISAQLFYKNGLTKKDIEFWWKSYGVNHALWDTGNEPDDFCDLWNDVLDSIYEIDSWKQSPPSNTFFNLHQNSNNGSLAMLGNCERVALWGTNL